MILINYSESNFEKFWSELHENLHGNHARKSRKRRYLGNGWSYCNLVFTKTFPRPSRSKWVQELGPRVSLFSLFRSEFHGNSHGNHARKSRKRKYLGNGWSYCNLVFTKTFPRPSRSKWAQELGPRCRYKEEVSNIRSLRIFQK